MPNMLKAAGRLTLSILLLSVAVVFGGATLYADSDTWTGQVVDLACYSTYGQTDPGSPSCREFTSGIGPQALLVDDRLFAVLASTGSTLPYEQVEIRGYFTEGDGIPVLVAESFRSLAADSKVVPEPAIRATDLPPDVQPIRVGGEVEAPKIVHQVAPEYTPEAKTARVQGVVIVQAVIDRSGSVLDVAVLKGLPLGLTEAAVAAVRQWHFEPATLDGAPVDVYYNLVVNFRLE